MKENDDNINRKIHVRSTIKSESKIQVENTPLPISLRAAHSTRVVSAVRMSAEDGPTIRCCYLIAESSVLEKLSCQGGW